MGYKGATKGPQTPGITTSAFILVVIHRKTIMSSQGPIGKLAHGVTSSIGFVSEVHGYRKAKKAARKERELEGQQLPSPSQSPPPDNVFNPDRPAKDLNARRWAVKPSSASLNK